MYKKLTIVILHCLPAFALAAVFADDVQAQRAKSNNVPANFINSPNQFERTAQPGITPNMPVTAPIPVVPIMPSGPFGPAGPAGPGGPRGPGGDIPFTAPSNVQAQPVVSTDTSLQLNTATQAQVAPTNQAPSTTVSQTAV